MASLRDEIIKGLNDKPTFTDVTKIKQEDISQFGVTVTNVQEPPKGLAFNTTHLSDCLNPFDKGSTEYALFVGGETPSGYNPVTDIVKPSGGVGLDKNGFTAKGSYSIGGDNNHYQTEKITSNGGNDTKSKAELSFGNNNARVKANTETNDQELADGSTLSEEKQTFGIAVDGATAANFVGAAPVGAVLKAVETVTGIETEFTGNAGTSKSTLLNVRGACAEQVDKIIVDAGIGAARKFINPGDTSNPIKLNHTEDKELGNLSAHGNIEASTGNQKTLIGFSDGVYGIVEGESADIEAKFTGKFDTIFLSGEYETKLSTNATVLKRETLCVDGQPVGRNYHSDEYGNAKQICQENLVMGQTVSNIAETTENKLTVSSKILADNTDVNGMPLGTVKVGAMQDWLQEKISSTNAMTDTDRGTEPTLGYDHRLLADEVDKAQQLFDQLQKSYLVNGSDTLIAPSLLSKKPEEIPNAAMINDVSRSLYLLRSDNLNNLDGSKPIVDRHSVLNNSHQEYAERQQQLAEGQRVQELENQLAQEANSIELIR